MALRQRLAYRFETDSIPVKDDAPGTMARSSSPLSVREHPAPRGLSRRERMPARIVPMLAVLSDLPQDQENWAFEYKWDGVRATSYWDGRALRIELA